MVESQSALSEVSFSLSLPLSEPPHRMGFQLAVSCQHYNDVPWGKARVDLGLEK